MKATKVFYQRCFNLGNYQNEVIGVELELDDDDKANDAMEKARCFVNSQKCNPYEKEEYERCNEIVSNPDNYTGKEVKDAVAYISKYDKRYCLDVTYF